MLYDPKWEVKSDPLSIESFIEWLERKPPAAGYEFFEMERCALGQYFLEKCGSTDNSERATLARKDSQLGRLYQLVIPTQGKDGQTFGAILNRARAALSA